MFFKKIPQFFRFALIGFINTLCHGLILTALVELLALQVVLSNFFAFLVANLLSYYMNSYFTFHRSPSFILYIKFFIASLFSLAMTLGIAWITNYYGLHYLLGFLIIIAVVPLTSFVVVKYWTFSSRISA